MPMNEKQWNLFFEHEAQGYLSNDFTRNTAFEVDFIIHELGIGEKHRVLDVGCGTGALTRQAIEKAAPRAVTGIDLSHGFLAYARGTTGVSRQMLARSPSVSCSAAFRSGNGATPPCG